jgi:hypothetical protein
MQNSNGMQKKFKSACGVNDMHGATVSLTLHAVSITLHAKHDTVFTIDERFKPLKYGIRL